MHVQPLPSLSIPPPFDDESDPPSQTTGAFTRTHFPRDVPNKTPQISVACTEVLSDEASLLQQLTPRESAWLLHKWYVFSAKIFYQMISGVIRLLYDCSPTC